MIFDCFTFFNELDLLEMRLNELDSIVDKFVLVESTVTFTNKRKRLFFNENKERYKQFRDKIIHIIVNDDPSVMGNPWIIEEHQFNALTRGLIDCNKEDTVLLSCVDEIPNSLTKQEWCPKHGKITGLSQDLYYYYLNCKVVNSPWIGTRIVRFGDITERFRPYIIRYSPLDAIVQNGGWHFSYMGGAEKIREKIFSFSHQEYNNSNYNTPEKIQQALQNRTDLFNRNMKFEIVDKHTLPKYVQKNIQKFQSLLTSKVKKTNSFNNIFWKMIGKVRKNLYEIYRI